MREFTCLDIAIDEAQAMANRKRHDRKLPTYLVQRGSRVAVYSSKPKRNVMMVVRPNA